MTERERLIELLRSGTTKFWVIRPKETVVSYINTYGMASDRKGVCFEIVAAYDTKSEAISKAEEIINSGEWVFVHDVHEHIDLYQKNQWEYKKINKNLKE